MEDALFESQRNIDSEFPSAQCPFPKDMTDQKIHGSKTLGIDFEKN